MELAELTVRGFTEEIASASPAPGGGSAAALAGAVGAALTAMVSGLTLGRKKYEAVQELALRAQAQADVLRKGLRAAMEQDTQAFLQVSAAYAMPKQTLEEKQARSSAIEQGLKACTQPPLAVMQLCAEGLELLESLLAICPPGGIVLDAFMGSGSTGVAAVKTGRIFIGMELSDQYFDTATKRIQEAEDELLNDF